MKSGGRSLQKRDMIYVYETTDCEFSIESSELLMNRLDWLSAVASNSSGEELVTGVIVGSLWRL